MTDATFKKVGTSDTPMFGPPKILACGFDPEGQQGVLALIEGAGLTRFPIVFVPGEAETRTLKALIAREDRSGLGETPGKTRALILSGFTENELRTLLAALRGQGEKRPLLATLTPTSESWTLRHLLTELSREAEEMRRLKRGNATPEKTS